MNNPDDETLSLLIAKAFSLQQNDQIEESISIFQSILKKHPTHPHVLQGLGMSFAQQRQWQQSVYYLEKALHAAPEIPEFHLNLANAYKAAGKIEEALIHYREALRLKPNYPQAHNNLGTLAYRVGKYEEAALHFQKALRMDPQAVDTHYNLANCYIQLDRLLEAVPHYREVLKLRSDHLGAMQNLGITLCALKSFSEAEPLLQQVIEREPNNIDVLFHLGIIYSTHLNLTKAQDCYEKVLMLDPNHGNSHHNLATVYLELNKRDKALAHYQEALRIQPFNKTAQHMIDALCGKTLKEGAPLEYTRALFDQYAYNYDEHVKKTLHYQVPALLREAIAPFAKQKTTSWTALDLGCGTGLCAPLFADIADKMIGIDVSPNMIEMARQQGGYVKLYVDDILSFLSDKISEYDLIIAADVFVYFGDLSEVFTGCYRALKSKGLFCFSIEKRLPEEAISHPEWSDFQLRQTGRYTHDPKYIHALCNSALLNIEVEKEAIIRYQEGSPIHGMIYVLSKIENK